MNSSSDAQPLSDAQILQQVEAERGGAGSVVNRVVGPARSFLLFALGCAVFAGTFAIRVRSRAEAAPTALAVAPLPIYWNYSFEDGQRRARSENKKMMVGFYADWCPACKWMDGSVYNRAEVQGEAPGVVMVKVNSDARRDLARRYNVRVLPSVVWIDGSGAELARHDGSLRAPELAELMAQNR